MTQPRLLTKPLHQYFVITGNYWAFTLTDGALRMLVVLHFHNLGYSPLAIAMLFLFYEIFGIITNLVGGWLGARFGLNRTMNMGLGLQILALAMLLVPDAQLTVIWVMAAQALSGIAKDLNKMSAKSAIKTLVPVGATGKLYKWVAVLTGSKNALKGVGFFIGGALLALVGFQSAAGLMMASLALVFLLSIIFLTNDIGKARAKPRFTDIFSKSAPVNYLSAARMFLFGSRDVWFVVALPVFLASTLGWSQASIGSFFAIWIIGYGFIQSLTPVITGRRSGRLPDGLTAFYWATGLAAIPIFLGFMINNSTDVETILLIGLMVFGALFAINSAVHSFLIVDYAARDSASLDVGFYYMANAAGRLLGTVLSGWVFQIWGLAACLWISGIFLLITAAISLGLPKRTHPS